MGILFQLNSLGIIGLFNKINIFDISDIKDNKIEVIFKTCHPIKLVKNTAFYRLIFSEPVLDNRYFKFAIINVSIPNDEISLQNVKLNFWSLIQHLPTKYVRG